MIDSGFETTSLRMTLLLLVTFQAPATEVDRIMDAVVAIAPPAMGKYDRNAYQSAHGIERCGPLDGVAAGAETELRRRPGTVEVSFELPDDQALAARVAEAIFQAHSYHEPVIRIQPILASRSKRLDGPANPNRGWNMTGDRKKAAAPEAETV